MASTQDFIPIKNIREGVITLDNNNLRIILTVSSLNFSLKSKEEQDSIIYQFQSFLNSLDFSCQILVQSRKINIIGYLDRIKKIEKKEKNELLQFQIKEYIKFIEKIMAEGSIMQKSFFLTVPFSPVEIKSKEKLSEEKYQRNKNQLLQRTEFIILGLKSCGLHAIPLKSEEIIELLWSMYHLKEAESGYYPEFPNELIK